MKIDLIGTELELPYNIADADDMEELEKKNKELFKILEDLEKIYLEKSWAKDIRKATEATKNWLDDVFGSGTGEKILSGKEDARLLYQIYAIMINLHAVYFQSFIVESMNEAMKKYSPTRATRKNV